MHGGKNTLELMQIINKKLLTFTRNHLDPLFRIVSRGSRGPSWGSPRPLGSVARRFRELLKALEGPEKILEG